MPEPTTHWAPQADGAGSASAAPLATEVITDPARLEELRGAWDELAVAARRPYSSPAWLLSWWRHARPVEARLATVVSSDGESVVGIAPFWYAGRGPGGAIYSLLGGRLATPTGPLAAPRREAEVATATARALADAPPRPVAIRLDRQASEPDWPRLLAAAWPGRRPWTYAAAPVRAPRWCSVTRTGTPGWRLGARTSAARRGACGGAWRRRARASWWSSRGTLSARARIRGAARRPLERSRRLERPGARTRADAGRRGPRTHALGSHALTRSRPRAAS